MSLNNDSIVQQKIENETETIDAVKATAAHTNLENKNQKDFGLGRGVYISTYGCQMNVNDTERMYSLLEMSNSSSKPKSLLASASRSEFSVVY